jgi:putative copper resistance protein D
LEIIEVFHILVRWAHLVSATAWVGGSLFWLLIVNPASKKTSADLRGFASNMSSEFHSIVNTCIFIMIVTGAIMTFNKITPGTIGPIYLILLGFKIALVLIMIYLIRTKRKPPEYLTKDIADSISGPKTFKIARILSNYNLIVIIGLIVYLISDILKFVYEISIA